MDPNPTTKGTVYDWVTEKIVAQLEAGVIPWQKPWTSQWPMNLITKKPYRGLNVFLLSVAGYASPYWLTFNQVRAKKGHVRKGEHGTMVVFWKPSEYLKKDADTGEEETKKYMLLRYYMVFNVEQCDGLNVPAVATIEKQESAEKIIAGMPHAPKIHQSADRAAYSPLLDEVFMPSMGRFASPDGYYSTLFHELTHATGHKSRLDRPGVTSHNEFGSEDYSKEELVAEFGAAMLSSVAGITRNVENSAAYIQHWLGVLKADKRMLVSAAGAAQKAADYILNRSADVVTEEAENAQD